MIRFFGLAAAVTLTLSNPALARGAGPVYDLLAYAALAYGVFACVVGAFHHLAGGTSDDRLAVLIALGIFGGYLFSGAAALGLIAEPAFFLPAVLGWMAAFVASAVFAASVLLSERGAAMHAVKRNIKLPLILGVVAFFLFSVGM